MEQTAVYIGSGLDVRPIRVLSHIKRFIYIDSRPATEQPTINSKSKYNQYWPDFIHDFNRKMEVEDFDWNWDGQHTTNTICLLRSKKNNTKPFMIEYFSLKTDVKVHYYMNTAFPQDITDDIIAELKSANTLVIAGFHPHVSVVQLMKKPVHIVCWEGTWYGNDHDDADEENSIIRKLYTDPNNTQDIASISFYKKQYVKTEFENIQDLENYRLTL
jgi:hypothetical protein